MLIPARSFRHSHLFSLTVTTFAFFLIALCRGNNLNFSLICSLFRLIVAFKILFNLATDIFECHDEADFFICAGIQGFYYSLKPMTARVF